MGHVGFDHNVVLQDECADLEVATVGVASMVVGLHLVGVLLNGFAQSALGANCILEGEPSAKNCSTIRHHTVRHSCAVAPNIFRHLPAQTRCRRWERWDWDIPRHFEQRVKEAIAVGGGRADYRFIPAQHFLLVLVLVLVLLLLLLVLLLLLLLLLLPLLPSPGA